MISDKERDALDKRNQPIPAAWRKPCRTCGKDSGFQDDVPPYYIWCIRSECEACHHAKTPVEWQLGEDDAWLVEHEYSDHHIEELMNQAPQLPATEEPNEHISDNL